MREAVGEVALLLHDHREPESLRAIRLDFSFLELESLILAQNERWRRA